MESRRTITKANKVRSTPKEQGALVAAMPVVSFVDTMSKGDEKKFVIGLESILHKVHLQIEEGTASIPFTFEIRNGSEVYSNSIGPISKGVYEITLDLELGHNSQIVLFAEKDNDLADCFISLIILTPTKRVDK